MPLKLSLFPLHSVQSAFQHALAAPIMLNFSALAKAATKGIFVFASSSWLFFFYSSMEIFHTWPQLITGFHICVDVWTHTVAYKQAWFHISWVWTKFFGVGGHMLIQRGHLQLDRWPFYLILECHIIKLAFPFVHYNQSPWFHPTSTSQLFTGVNGLTLMPVSLPQEM